VRLGRDRGGSFGGISARHGAKGAAHLRVGSRGFVESDQPAGASVA